MFSVFNLYDFKLILNNKLLFFRWQAKQGQWWRNGQVSLKHKGVGQTFGWALDWVLLRDFNDWTVWYFCFDSGYDELLGKPFCLWVLFSLLLEQCVSQDAFISFVRVNLVGVNCIVIVSVNLNTLKNGNIFQHNIWSFVSVR